jgi:20S proteasome alpha/beta subunit
MTFCLGITVKEGIVAIADTRITAGNEVYSNKKISIHEINNHSLFIMTAGLRSVRDKAVTYFNQAIEEEEENEVGTDGWMDGCEYIRIYFLIENIYNNANICVCT